MMTNKEMQFKAGVAQFNVANGVVRGNMDQALRLLKKLADRGCRLAVLPEMFSTGFDNERIGELAGHTPWCLDQLAGAARDNHIMICGSMPVSEQGKVYNALFIVGRDGRVAAEYRKLHLFRLTREHEYYAPGDKIQMVETDLGCLGLMICYDLRFPELSGALQRSGAALLIVSAQWPAARADHWQTLVRARAIETQAFVIAANRTGRDDDLVFPGLSMIVAPSGEVLACADGRPGVRTADIDLDLVEETRKQIPVMTDRRKDVYG